MSNLPVSSRFGAMDKPRLRELDPVPSRKLVQLVPLGFWRRCFAMNCFSLAHAGLPHRECVKINDNRTYERHAKQNHLERRTDSSWSLSYKSLLTKTG